MNSRASLLILSLLAVGANCANILGLFTSPSPSHVIIQMSVARALIEQGHNLTVITSVPLKDTAGFRHIYIGIDDETTQQMNANMAAVTNAPNKLKAFFEHMIPNLKLLVNVQYDLLKDEKFLSFLAEGNQFDALLLGYFLNDFQLGIGAHFRCPIMLIWPGPPYSHINSFIGNPSEVAYVPIMNSPSTEAMTFKDRTVNFVSSFVMNGLELYTNYQMQKYYDEYFPSDKYPSFKDMIRNVSLVFCNHHFSNKPIRPNLPALVEIAGITIKDTPDALDEELQTFLDSASKHGAILFSLGTNVRSSSLEQNTIDHIYYVLSNLKQKVLWKWEDEHVPGNAKNIIFRKWLPQDDILAHRNVKLFITHGGKGSVTESIYHGVPMVGLPVFGDQTSNIESMVGSGYGLSADYRTMSRDTFRKAIVDVLANQTYADNVKRFSSRFRDRPLTAKQTAVFWTEYVLRHQGAAHIQSPVMHMNFLQAWSIDVMVFLIVLVFVFVKIVKLIFWAIYLLFKFTKNKVKTD